MSDQKQNDVILNCQDKHSHGKKIILPNIGEVDVDKDGNLTVDDVTASLLLNQSSNNFKLVKGNETTVPNSEDDKTEHTEDDAKPNTEVEDGLEELKLTELIDLAVKGEFEESEYSKFTKSKKLMINFLRKKAVETK